MPPALANEIIDATSDLPNRLYRYPLAKALLPILGKIPGITPNRVTYAHIVIGLLGAALVAFTERHIWLVVAFAFLEMRMILDCFDGVLARAQGSSSPFGRALDEIADTISYITLMCAMTHRLHNGSTGVAVTCLVLIFAGLSANAWDFYKRKFTTVLRDGKDGVLEEIRLKKDLIESGKGTFLGYWGVYFDCFQVLLYEVRPVEGNVVSVIRARATDPAFRRFVGMLAFLSTDNTMAILHIGVLTGLFFGAQLFTLGYAFTMWIAAMVIARTVLRTYPSRMQRRTV